MALLRATTSPPRHRRSPAALWLALLLVPAALRAPPVHAGEVVETFDDGSPKLKYLTNAQGQKEGRYAEYHPNGRVAVEATYRADQLDGTWSAYFESGKLRVRTAYKAGRRSGRSEEYAESGDPTFTGTYADDVLNGKVERFLGKKQVSTQVWRNGELVTLEGVAVHPRSVETLRKTVVSILSGAASPQGPVKGKGKGHKPTPAPEEAPAELVAKRAEALRRLQAFRFLCGVPYEDLRLGATENMFAQGAAEISARIGRVDHEPPNPGLPDDQYRIAAKGAKSCNLDPEGAVPSIDAYFHDSDPSNVKRVGHRRWCLNPAMVVTGFGEAADPAGKRFSAMWAMDSSRVQIPEYDAVCYPTQGYMPLDFFAAERAWSVSPNPLKFPNVPLEGGVDVRVYRLAPDFTRPEKPLELDLLTVHGEVGSGACVIFRPKAVDLEEGAAYWVEVFGLDAKPKKPGERPRKGAEPSLRYLVHFCAAVKPAVADGSTEEER